MITRTTFLALIVMGLCLTAASQNVPALEKPTQPEYPLGNLQNYTPPIDSDYFSEVMVHLNLTTGRKDSVVMDTTKFIREIKSEEFIPPTMPKTDVIVTERYFGALSPAYQISGFPNYPMSAIVRLEMYDANNNLLGTCSGGFINKNTVLSAAHCVHTPPTYYTSIANIKVIPAYDNGYAPYGEYWATGFWLPNNWINNNDWNYDLLVINLTGNPGETTGYLGWWAGSGESTYLSSSSIFNTFGYPATTLSQVPVYDNGYRMWHMQGYFDFFGDGFSLGSNIAYHNNQGFKGLSGSTTYLFDNGNRFVMAILSHGFDPPSVPNSITGHARLNTFLGNFINTYAPETVGVEDLEADRFTLYPNPCNQKLSIVGLNGRQIDYTVIDMAGKTIAIGTTGSDIATDEIAPGFYQLLLDNASYKFLVHR